MAMSPQLVPVSGWLSLPRYVYRHRIHSGYFEDQLMGRPGFSLERTRRLEERMASLGIPLRSLDRPEYLCMVDRRWKESFGNSTPEDVFRADGTDPQEEDTEEGRLAATERLAVGLARSWRTSPPVRSAVHERAQTEGDGWSAAKKRAAAVGVSLAVARMGTPQRIRFGNQYVVYADGRPADVDPVKELAATSFIRWLHRQAIAEAEALVLEEAPRGAPVASEPETVPLDDCVFLEDVVAGDLEEAVFTAVDLEALLDAAALTPAERELVAAFRLTGEWPEAARVLDLPLPAMRQRKRRLLAKLAPG